MKDSTKELESTYEEYLGRLLSAYRVSRGETGEIAQRSLTENVARILRGGVRPSMEGTSQIAEEDGIPQQIWEKALPVALASRELEYRRIRRDAFRDRYGLNPGDTVSLPQLEEIFNATNTDKEVRALFGKVIALAKSLGVEVKVEENDGEERDALGKAKTQYRSSRARLMKLMTIK